MIVRPWAILAIRGRSTIHWPPTGDVLALAMSIETKATGTQQSVRPELADSKAATSCPVPSPPDLSNVTVVELRPEPPVADYLEAMRLANARAAAQLGENMLLSWYDRDRDFESPQHAGECHQDCAVPGYVDYALHRGATLKIDVENGRFVFFYIPLDF